MASGDRAPDDPAAPPDGAAGIVAHFRRQVHDRPDRAALHFRTGGRWTAVTWAQFGTASERIAAYLLSEDLGEHEHAAIWSGNRPEWHIADIGILSARLRPVPIYLALSAVQAQYCLEHARTRVCFVENETVLRRLLEVRDRAPSLRRVVLMDGDAATGDGLVITWQEALRRGAAKLADGGGQELDRRMASVTGADVCTIIYTSGTTGPPKAAQITHRNILAGTAGVAAFIDSDADDRMLSYLPLAHVAERMITEFHSYIFGNPTWFLDSIANLGEVLREVRPTLFFGVPRVWEKLASAVQTGLARSSVHRRLLARWAMAAGERVARIEIDGGRVGGRLRTRHALAERLVLRTIRAQMGLDEARTVASGAAPMSVELLIYFRALGLEICEIYGLTETCGGACMNRPGSTRPGTVGPPLPGNEVRIAEDGEILVRGGVIFSGYEDDDVATAEALDGDGWFRTGDVGSLSADGFLTVTDRKKDIIITAGGRNVAPANLEALLAHHPMVGTAVAIGERRPYMTALLTLDADGVGEFGSRHGLSGDIAAMSGSREVLDELQGHLDSVNAHLSNPERVQRFAVLPHGFTLGDELTPTLKVRRAVIAERYAAVIDAMYARPRDQAGGDPPAPR